MFFVLSIRLVESAIIKKSRKNVPLQYYTFFDTVMRSRVFYSISGIEWDESGSTSMTPAAAINEPSPRPFIHYQFCSIHVLNPGLFENCGNDIKDNLHSYRSNSLVLF